MRICVDMGFAKKLRDATEKRGIGASDLSRLPGVPASTIGNITNGSTLPRVDNAFRLAKALGESLDYLADDAQDEPPANAGGLSIEERSILTLAKAWDYETVLRRLQFPPEVRRASPADER